ncbi:MAG: LPS assembly protein LptD [Hydrogenobacter thermophilus]|uniref:LPS-assembly protein LptD n=1 Tax=Hydrogenobacter thermophilus TaxID=940 RepID=UPI001C761712|nr:LPS assembly protein LptD [Hydrogenobacter thermophilus]QWK19623.1 MAG: LPS assembly protein LptD [Hydrogenobacter thermophilus]
MLRTALSLILSISFAFSVEILSDYLERLPDETVIAKGNVQAYYENYYIEADYVKYHPKSREVYAEGNVYVKSLDGRMEAWAKVAFLNLKENSGYFIDSHGRFEKFYLRAKRVDKEGDVYTIEEGDITTCPPDKKEMTLCFFHAKVTDKYVFSYSNSLRLFSVPLAYLPLSVFPVGERRSGLLPPLLGSNTYNTFIYQQPVYWAISQDKDATLTLDIRDKQASGISLEYRQAISHKKDLQGAISIYREPTPPGKWWEGRDLTTFRENRYRLKFDLDLGNFQTGLDTVSDPYLLQDVYLHTKDRTVPYLTSYVSYKKNTDKFLFTFNARRFYDNTSPDNKQTLQRLPEIGIYYKDTPVFKGLYFNATLAYTNFYRERGAKANRVIFFPELSLPLNLLGRTFYSNLTFENGLYLSSNLPNSDKSFYTLHFNQRLPLFFDKRWGKVDLKNVFEVSYSYRPKGYNNPRFDALDSIDKENQIKFILRNYTMYDGRLLLSWYLEGGYSFLGSFTYTPFEYLLSTPFAGQPLNTTSGKIVVNKNLMPIRSILSLSPLPFLSLSSDTLYDPNSSRFLNSTSYLNLNLKNSNITLGYVGSKDFFGNRLTDQTLLSANTLYKNVNINLGVVHDNRINKDLLRQMRVDYTGACWSLGVLLRDTYDGNRKKYIKEVFLAFNVFDLQRFTLPLKR